MPGSFVFAVGVWAAQEPSPITVKSGNGTEKSPKELSVMTIIAQTEQRLEACQQTVTPLCGLFLWMLCVCLLPYPPLPKEISKKIPKNEKNSDQTFRSGFCGFRCTDGGSNHTNDITWENIPCPV